MESFHVTYMHIQELFIDNMNYVFVILIYRFMITYYFKL